MTINRIRQLAEFFYSSNSAVDVPLRISCITGQFTGFDLDRESFISLFKILTKSQNLKEDLAAFVECQYDQHE
jgi:hypothetical protein